MAFTNDEDYDAFVVLHALGKLKPDVATDFEKELEKQPDLADRVDKIRFLDGVLSGTIPLHDVSDEDDDFEDYDIDEKVLKESFGDKQSADKLKIERPEPVNKIKSFLTLKAFSLNAALVLLVVLVVGLLFSVLINKRGSSIQVAQNNSNEENKESQSSSQADNGGDNNPLKNSHSGRNELISLSEPGPAPASPILWGADDDINPLDLTKEDSSDDDFLEETIDVQTKNVDPDSTKPLPIGESAILRDVLYEVIPSQFPEKEESLLSTFSKQSLDKQEVKIAVSQFYKLLNDYNAKVADFENISNELTPEIIEDDEELKSFKAVIDEIVKKVKKISEKK